MTFEKNMEIDWKLIFNYSSYVFCAADIKNYIEKFIKYYGNEASNWLLFLLLTFLCDFPARSTSCIWLSLFFTFLLQVLFVCNVEGLDKHLREGKVKENKNRERERAEKTTFTLWVMHGKCLYCLCQAYATIALYAPEKYSTLLRTQNKFANKNNKRGYECHTISGWEYAGSRAAQVT